MEGEVEWLQVRVGSLGSPESALHVCGHTLKAVVLNWGQFCPLGSIWRYLETLLVVTAGRGVIPGV